MTTKKTSKRRTTRRQVPPVVRPPSRSPTKSSLDFLCNVLLTDSDGNRAPIISVRGGEAGLDHLGIITQSTAQRSDGIAMRSKIYSEEITRDEKGTSNKKPQRRS